MANENTNYVEYLVELAQRGRRNAFFDLCEIIVRNIYNVVARLIVDREIANSIVVATFLVAWDNIKSYDKNTSFLIWVEELAVKYSVDQLKRRSYNTSNKKLENTEDDEHRRLDKMIESLEDENRIIFVLHDIEGYEYNEILRFFPGLSQDEIKTKLINTREYLLGNL